MQCYSIHSDSQVLVSNTSVYEPFKQIEKSENEAVEFCIIVWGPLTEALHVLVETTDSALALGKPVSTMSSLLDSSKCI